MIDIATRKIVWRYGTPGTHGAGPNQLWNPDDAMMLPDGPSSPPTSRTAGWSLSPASPRAGVGPGHAGQLRAHTRPTSSAARTAPSRLPNGHFLVTEINGDWVDEIDRTGHVYWSTHPPAMTYPSDSNQYQARAST